MSVHDEAVATKQTELYRSAVKARVGVRLDPDNFSRRDYYAVCVRRLWNFSGLRDHADFSALVNALDVSASAELRETRPRFTV